MNKTIGKLIPMMLLSCIFILFAWKEGDDGLTKQQKLLVQIGNMLERYHYSSPVINDDFSKAIWMEYINSLDGKKNLLLQADVNELKKYDKYLDNEMHGDSIEFFPQAIALYTKRCTEASAIYKQVLANAFTFGKNDLINLDRTPKEFPKDEAERANRWKNMLRFQTLQKLIELQEIRDKSKAGDATYHKTDAALEQEARAFLLKQYDRIFARYKSYSQDKLFSNYLNVIARYVDPHSDYLAPLDKKSFDQRMGNRFFGTGIQLQEGDGIIKMMSFTPGSPSNKSGEFTINDQLTKVGQGESGPMVDITGMEISDVVGLIRGEKGTIVRIGYRKADGTNRVTSLVRAEIKQEEALARSAVIEDKGKKIGYIYLPMFYDDFGNANGSHCAADVAAEIEKLKTDHVEGLVMDLRFNGGGSLKEVVRMVGLFVGPGPVVQTRDGKGKLQVLESKAGQPLYTGPLTVLVNEFSASASEIFAGAIQDYKRGVIIGAATFGKGTVQTTAPLSQEDYGAFKLTISKFYRVDGGSTQQKGVIPDLILPDGRETGKYHEGDQPYAMPWDKVVNASYKTWNTNIDSLTTLATLRVNKTPAFTTIGNNNTWLEDHPDTAMQMTVMQYKMGLSSRRKIGKQNEEVQKLLPSQLMDVKPAVVIDKEKEASYKEWFKKIAADIYIKEAVNVILDF